MRWKENLFWFWQFAKHHCFVVFRWKTMDATNDPLKDNQTHKNYICNITITIISMIWISFKFNVKSHELCLHVPTRKTIKKPSNTHPHTILRLRQRRQHGTWMWHLLSADDDENGPRWPQQESIGHWLPTQAWTKNRVRMKFNIAYMDIYVYIRILDVS